MTMMIEETIPKSNITIGNQLIPFRPLMENRLIPLAGICICYYMKKFDTGSDGILFLEPAERINKFFKGESLLNSATKMIYLIHKQ